MEHFIVPLGVAGIAAEFFKSRDIVVDLWELHATVLKLSSSSVLLLGILVLFCEFMQELIPYIRNIVMDRV